MTASPPRPQEHRPADGALAERVTAALRRRTGPEPFTDATELAALGVDSLLLLRVIADLALDPTQEIDPQGLAEVITVADLRAFVARWHAAS
ncbi:phosphopantetheine-binding protein [Streptomyces sp. ISL-11]|uniref:phosphopantetheine-binding protein n=1 Tax=Streptomyces sp. ISL-11 TaxID=2819174 RepID=UPI001BECAADB|nr:phosphopantetheine-binding protein [Streptomyces sp. ISL-11]MBT2383368.1 acyl carrier protein [Streptomyces sp. ISL-11]